jgi:hypothetical protein
MEGNPRRYVGPERIIKDRIPVIDRATASPEQRAHKLLTILQKALGEELKPWDLICLGEEIIVSMAGEYEWLQPPARQLASLVYNAHYMASEELGIV